MTTPIQRTENANDDAYWLQLLSGLSLAFEQLQESVSQLSTRVIEQEKRLCALEQMARDPTPLDIEGGSSVAARIVKIEQEQAAIAKAVSRVLTELQRAYGR